MEVTGGRAGFRDVAFTRQLYLVKTKGLTHPAQMRERERERERA